MNEISSVLSNYGIAVDQRHMMLLADVMTYKVCCSVCCSVVECVAVCCSVLQCVAVRCIVLLKYGIAVDQRRMMLLTDVMTCRVCCSVWCSVLRCGTVCCSVLQCVTVRCIVLLKYGIAVDLRHMMLLTDVMTYKVCCSVCCSVLQCGALCCGVLQCVAVRCIVLSKYGIAMDLRHMMLLADVMTYKVCCSMLQCGVVCSSVL